MALSVDEKRDLLALMVRSRAFEEIAGALAASGDIPGSWLSGIGQEGTLGVIAQLRSDDYLTYTHRGAYGFIGRGCDPKRLLAELLGKNTGYCKGKGGRHIADLEHGILGKSGTIGAHAPLAAGVATAIQIRGDDAVVVSVFGEGTSNRGTTHSSMNMAAIGRLPLVWVCENNSYVGSVPAPAYLAVADVAAMAGAYGMPATIVDGNDVIAVHEAAAEAIARARAGNGPSLLELKTYRTRPFGETGTDKRDQEEIAAWRRRDPVDRFCEHLITDGIVTRSEADEITATAEGEMSAAARFARQSPWPDPAAAFEDLYA